MLRLLRVRDFALLEQVEVAFDRGFNVLTGETGVGKSLLVQAVMLLRGERADAHTVRSGAEEATLEALFGEGDQEMVLSRVIAAAGAGRGRAYVGSRLSTLGEVATLMAARVDVAGQHEHQTLSDARRHREILDAFGKISLSAMTQLWDALADTQQALERAIALEQGRAEREDFLRFQIQEIDAANLQVGDEQRLPQERERQRQARRLMEVASLAEEALTAGEHAVSVRLAKLQRELASAARIDGALEPFSKQIEEARVLLDELGREFSRYGQSLEEDPGALAALEEHCEQLRRLQRKHGNTAEEILQRRAGLAGELGALESAQGKCDELRRKLDMLQAEANAVAGTLSLARQAAGRRLAASVQKQLQSLGMAGARFDVLVEKTEAGLGAVGWDQVEFRLAPNLGEGLRPLARIASGGELSRVMLALRRILLEADPVPTIVFDEVDAGVSGAVAETIGRLLRELGRKHQVLCVTHQAPVAAWADAHFVVDKRTRAGRTTAQVRRLNDSERREELARMLTGSTVTEHARAHAEEMLQMVNNMVV